MAGKTWTIEEIEFIKTNYSELGAQGCAEVLNRTANSIKQKACAYKIKSNNTLSSRAWTEEENTILRINYPIVGTAGCAELLLNRTNIAIKNQAGRLKIRVNNPWVSTHEEYERKLLELEAECYPVDKYVTSKIPIRHACTEGHEWLARPSNVLKGSGCPSCAYYGFNPDKPAILYYIKVTSDAHKYYKIGITNRTILARFSRETDKNIEILLEKTFVLGSEAYLEEQDILYKYRDKRIVVNNFLKSKGNTELFAEDVLGLDTEKAQ